MALGCRYCADMHEETILLRQELTFYRTRLDSEKERSLGLERKLDALTGEQWVSLREEMFEEPHGTA
jgi:hypothetical protein